MSDENVASESAEVPQMSQVDVEASEQGWVPQAEFKGPEHRWVDAGEFLRRGELFKKMDDQRRELKDLRSAVVEQRKLHAQVREVEYKRALDTLRLQKRQALQEGDADAVIAVEDQIDAVKEAAKQEAAQPTDIPSGQTEHPDFVSWKDRNRWYVTNEHMQVFADKIGRDLGSRGMAPQEVLKQVEAEVRKEFPTRFRNPNQDKPGAVEGGSSKGTAGTGKAFALSEEQRSIMKSFVRTGAMTEKQYIDDLKLSLGQ